MNTERVLNPTTDETVCICGNDVGRGDPGFQSCDETGNPVEPTDKDWTSGLTVCGECGRFFDETGEVKGQTTISIANRDIYAKER